MLTTLVPPCCNVLRNYQVMNILAEELVPGDVIKIENGDRVPADARLIICNSLSVDESSLTGESDARDKVTTALPTILDTAGLTDRANMLFMGTLTTSGNGVAVVTSTGRHTEFGKIFIEMKEVEEKRTPLQEKMDNLGNQLSYLSLGIIACIALIGVIQGKQIMVMFNIGVSLAVAAIPEGLPICVTVTLALGVMRMARKNAIVKHLPAVEALGCADFICTDKTGTLTQNRMTVARAYCPSMDDAVNFHFDNQVHVTGGMIGTYKGVQLTDVTMYPAMQALFEASCLCNNAHIVGDSTRNVGLPTELALLFASRHLNIVDQRPNFTRLSESVFNSDAKCMQITYRRPVSGVTGDVVMTYLKGEAEVVLPQCVNYMTSLGEVKPFSTNIVEVIAQQSIEMAKEGLRVLAFAMVMGGNKVTSAAVVFIGLIGLRDPLRPGVPDAVKKILHLY